MPTGTELTGTVALVTGESGGIGEGDRARPRAEAPRSRSPPVARTASTSWPRESPTAVAGRTTRNGSAVYNLTSAVLYIVTRPWRMLVNEMLIRPTEQEA